MWPRVPWPSRQAAHARAPCRHTTTTGFRATTPHHTSTNGARVRAQGIRRSSATLLAPSPRGALLVCPPAPHHSTSIATARVVAKPTAASAIRVRRATQDQRTRLPPARRGGLSARTASARRARRAPQDQCTRLPPARVPPTASARRARRAPQDQRTRLPPARVPPTASARRAARPARGRPATRYPHAP